MLLHEVGLTFTVMPSLADETVPQYIPAELVPRYLAEKKAMATPLDGTDTVIVAADTVVILKGSILNKPTDRKDAIRMLTMLSGQTHMVVTSVFVRNQLTSELIEDRTRVTFRQLDMADIERYVDQFKPFDKAGAYGAQECLPQGLNPCSERELNFLESIGKQDLLSRTTASPHDGQFQLEAIERINGSYFNVMGLPVHLVYTHLQGL